MFLKSDRSQLYWLVLLTLRELGDIDKCRWFWLCATLSSNANRSDGVIQKVTYKNKWEAPEILSKKKSCQAAVCLNWWANIIFKPKTCCPCLCHWNIWFHSRTYTDTSNNLNDHIVCMFLPSHTTHRSLSWNSAPLVTTVLQSSVSWNSTSMVGSMFLLK